MQLGLSLRRQRRLPCICEFYGIGIYMYYGDHAPPHFHAIYGEYEAEVSIRANNLREGFLPVRARRLVLTWARDHAKELEGNWERARKGIALRRIDPLN